MPYEFYAAISTVLEGMIVHSNRLAGKAEELARNESDPNLKRELLDMAAEVEEGQVVGQDDVPSFDDWMGIIEER